MFLFFGTALFRIWDGDDPAMEFLKSLAVVLGSVRVIPPGCTADTLIGIPTLLHCVSGIRRKVARFVLNSWPWRIGSRSETENAISSRLGKSVYGGSESFLYIALAVFLISSCEKESLSQRWVSASPVTEFSQLAGAWKASRFPESSLLRSWEVEFGDATGPESTASEFIRLKADASVAPISRFRLEKSSLYRYSGSSWEDMGEVRISRDVVLLKRGVEILEFEKDMLARMFAQIVIAAAFGLVAAFYFLVRPLIGRRRKLAWVCVIH